jgi:hypothetical protein
VCGFECVVCVYMLTHAHTQDRVLFPLLEMLRPHLHCGRCCGEERVALVSHDLRAAVLQRYWPSALLVRGTFSTFVPVKQVN